VTIEVPARACTVVLADGRRVVEPGDFALLVGPSSRTADLLRAGFRIER
jgi:beta-glucosidase